MVRRLPIAIIALLALSGCARSASDELDAAVRALPYRPIDGRLSRSTYAMRPALRRANEAAVPSELSVRSAARERFLFDKSEELRARASVFAGQTRRAKSLFKIITSRDNASAASWSDYAAVLHADAAPDDALQLVTALAATDRALDLSPNLPEALFNRGIALEALSLHGEAIRAYKRYLEADSSSRWAIEVRERLQMLESRRVRLDEWRNKLYELVEAAKAGDELFVNDVALAFPQESRAVTETIILSRWAECILENDRSCAAVMLRLCRIVGRTAADRRATVMTLRKLSEHVPDRYRALRAQFNVQRQRPLHREAMPPHLLLSHAKDDDGKLTAAEIGALKLDGIRTVVLAGYRTAVSVPGSSGTRSLVDAFLVAGAGSVVGTLWEVEDVTTRQMSISFHTALRDGATPAAALRAAQLAMIQRRAPPRVWASLQLYGSGS